MLVSKTSHGYARRKQYITGRGFVDSMSSVFNTLSSSLKSSLAPVFRNVSSYVSTNKDLIAKPLLGAIGSLAATGLTAGVPALVSRIMSRSRNKNPGRIPDDPKYKEILQNLLNEPRAEGHPVSNIIGSGARRRRGAGIKTF
jgi:hypothetical protein